MMSRATEAIRYHNSRLARPHYFHIVDQAARLGAALGYPAISVLELGVAGGRGLLALEAIARGISLRRKIQVDVFGIDTGQGLPTPEGYRDLPYHWKPGFYDMDENALRGQLEKAQLLIGDVGEVLPTLLSQEPPPIGAVSVDVDFYSSTKKALALGAADQSRLSPRVFFYFDDVIGDPIALYNEYTGELAAIREFNAESESRKLGRVRYLESRTVRRQWHRQIYALHVFDHDAYSTFVGEDNQGLPLTALARWLPGL
jgi:hypothetical protein